MGRVDWCSVQMDRTHATVMWTFEGGERPEGFDPDRLAQLLEAAVRTYVDHVEENGDAETLFPDDEGGAGAGP